MNRYDDFLLEIHTEELPAKELVKLAQTLCVEIENQLKKSELPFDAAHYFATPQRLAVIVRGLASQQPNQTIERKGPALAAAFDSTGKPSKACEGFARAANVSVNELVRIQNAQGEWLGCRQQVAGKSVKQLLPDIVTHVIGALPLSKRMRWGEGEVQFLRPVHSVIMLYGEEIIEAVILGCKTNRLTRGHRLLAPDWITISHAKIYESLLESKGRVIADFAKRRALIENQVYELQKKIPAKTKIFWERRLLDEVTGLVEWPRAIVGEFNKDYLALPSEVLLSSMKAHQRYFSLSDDLSEKLLPYFVAVSNMDVTDMKPIIQGNERVLHARLADAAFFYEVDIKELLETRLEKLKDIVYQTKLGTLYDKSIRLQKLAHYIAPFEYKEAASRAGLLAKTDLVSHMVNEFPDLQGTMGFYYARGSAENEMVCCAIYEQYLPRFAGDQLPVHPAGQALAVADRIDNLIGAFGIHQVPTGDKDPFGLRRAAIGVIRIALENKLSIDFKSLLETAKSYYAQPLENLDTVPQVWQFILDRLRVWYQEQSISANIFASVAALQLTNLKDMHERILAVAEFKQSDAAYALSAANKRVSNILAKDHEVLSSKLFDITLFQDEAEKALAEAIEAKQGLIATLIGKQDYREALLQLATLRQPVDTFFDQVMVMVEDKHLRDNRLRLLKELRALFLQVADIALLQ